MEFKVLGLGLWAVAERRSRVEVLVKQGLDNAQG